MYENFEFQTRITEAATDGYLRVQVLRRATAAMAEAIGCSWETQGLLRTSIEDIILVDGYDKSVLVKAAFVDMARGYFPEYEIIAI